MKTDSPSSTANIVAQNIAMVAAMKETSKLVSPETVVLNNLFVKTFSKNGATFLEKANQKWFQRLFHLYESVTIPGLALHQALRKMHIERAVRKSLAEGFEQVVILGGGLDVLALKLHQEFPNINFFELDHPATQRIKRETIEKHRLGNENLHLLASDFATQTLAESLFAFQSFNRAAKTVFICEGVLMYLEEREIDRIFGFISRQPVAANRFIFTFMEPDRNGKTNFRNSTFVVQLWLNLKKEPFKWGINRNELKDFLAKRNFSLIELATSETFRETYLKQFGLADYVIAEGENICICESMA